MNIRAKLVWAAVTLAIVAIVCYSLGMDTKETAEVLAIIICISISSWVVWQTALAADAAKKQGSHGED